MTRLKSLSLAIALVLAAVTPARADFILSIDPDDLTFSGPGFERL